MQRRSAEELSPSSWPETLAGSTFNETTVDPDLRWRLPSFSIPSMTRDGQTVTVAISSVALGVRRQPILVPRPLHDPMADHAIVLYDPTVDLVETDEERLEREKVEALSKKEEDRKKAQGQGPNPHKSLKEMLGIDSGEGQKKKRVKVPVVIDPRLCKVLRPHQVEGVKVRLGYLDLPLNSFICANDSQLVFSLQFLYRCTTGLLAPDTFGSVSHPEQSSC